MDEPAARLGLIAGAGRLPAEAAGLLAGQGVHIELFGFEGVSDPSLVPPAHRTRLGQLLALSSQLGEARIERLLIVGKFPKTLLFDSETPVSPDEEAVRLLADAAGWDDDGLLAAIAAWLDERGFEVARQDELLSPLLAEEGCLSDRRPSDLERADMESGLRVARTLGRAGVGQSAALQRGCVIALEAAEGTDAMIRRAGEVGGAGTTIVKASRPGQDRRFDLPAVGPDTIEAMRSARATALAIEAGSTLIIEAARFRESADNAGIAVWGFGGDPA